MTNAEIQCREGENIKDSLSRLRHQLSRESFKHPATSFIKPSKAKYIKRLKQLHLTKLQCTKQAKRYIKPARPIQQSQALGKYTAYLHNTLCAGKMTFRRNKYAQSSI